MKHIDRTTMLVVALALLLVAGCGQDDVAAPGTTPTVIAEDPLEDALKSADGTVDVAPQDRLARLAEILGLDEDQLAAVTEAYLTFRDGVADLRDQVRDGDLTCAEARAEVLLLREAFEAELQVILTAEQWDLLQELRQNRAGHPRGPHDCQGPVERWTEWLTEVGADEDQIADVIAALETMIAGMADLREQVADGTLTCEEARDAAEQLREDFDAALRSILTEEQYDALQGWRTDGDRLRQRDRDQDRLNRPE